MLPPRAYREAKLSLTEDGALGKDGEEEDGEGEEDEDEDEAEQEAVLDGKNDESYQRVRTLLEALLESGKRALESKPQDFVEHTGGTKVLSEEEARKWRRDDSDARSFVESEDVDKDDSSVYLAADGPRRSVTPSQVAIPDGEFDSEDEGEKSSVVDDTDGYMRTRLPPITVTPSTSP